MAKVRALNEIALERGQSLAQMALCWNLSFNPVASVLIGASGPEQIVGNVKALDVSSFTTDELKHTRYKEIFEQAENFKKYQTA